MSQRVAVRIVAGAIALSLTGCAAIESNPRAAKGTAIGAAGGAASGAAIGAIAGGGKGAGKGAAIGAVVGAIGGGLIGGYMDKQAREMEAIVAEQDRVRQEQERLQVVLASDVLFESGKSNLQPGAQDKLRNIAAVLNRYPQSNIEVVGHTDSRGGDEMNLELSRKRAQAVATELTNAGVSGARLALRGEGAARPVASNATPEGRQQNRRVEINIVPEGGAAQQTGETPPPPGGYEEPR